MKCDIGEIVALDRENMSPVIEKAGGTFDSERRSRSIREELESGAKFVFHVSNGKLQGYIEFKEELPGQVHVISIQLHSDCAKGVTLRNLLFSVYLQAKGIDLVSIRSSVHVTNVASLRLHRKLGFLKISETGHKVNFRIEGRVMVSKLAHILNIESRQSRMKRTTSCR